VRVITASRSEGIAPFTGLEPGQFRKLVRVVAKRAADEIADGCPGRQWRLDLPDRVLLVATYWRTNLTMRRLGPLFGVSHSATHRVIDTIGPAAGVGAGAQTAGRFGGDRATAPPESTTSWQPDR
jgi:Helix-turn-helix of DDE superfamily endonuclease